MEKIKKRFEDKFEAVTESGCWIWTACVWMQGRYGAFWVDDKFSNGRMTGAHRASLYIYKGLKAAPDESVCHTCDNTLCVNPNHLFIGSHTDNMRDMVNKGRHKSGTEKLTADQVNLAKRLRSEGEQVKRIAELLNIDTGYCSRLVKGCLPKHSKPS